MFIQMWRSPCLKRRAGVISSQCLGGLRHWGGTQSAWRMVRPSLSNLGPLPCTPALSSLSCLMLTFQPGTGQGQASELHYSDRADKHTLLGFTSRKRLEILSTEEIVFPFPSSFPQR